jgi:large subunit ribosomal protein L9
MKIILLKDVRGTGRRGDIKDVSDGYASNFLLPNKLAVAATAGSLAKAEAQKAKMDEDAKIHEDLVLKNLETLSGGKVTIAEKANDEGHLFAGIKTEEILKALKKDLGVTLAPEHLVLDKPIKETGEHTLQAESFGKKVSFTLVVEKKK